MKHAPMALLSGRRALMDDSVNTQGDSGGSDYSEMLAAGLLFELTLLGVVLVIGRFLSRFKVMWMGEAGAALLLGLVVGLILHLANAPAQFTDKLVFQTPIFLYVMLPTIMFDAGYMLDPKPFIRNVGSICLFAFVGTTVSTFVVGLLMYAFGLAGWCVQLGGIYNLLFGAIISATDPVTVLAVFSRLGANEDLYINVFGESVLNDAVAMVLYHTLADFVGASVTVANVFKAIGLFLGIFTGSVVFGIAVGLCSAYIFKSKWFHDKEDSLLETGIAVVLAFLSYLGAQAAYMSGICSVLFCGMVMRAFARPNLTQETQERFEALFRVMAGLFELFLFVYIGLTLFVEDEAYNIWSYAALVMVALAVSRACNIFPLSALVNYFRLPARRIPGKQQFMLWWSGLRGAMAFALALDAADQYGYVGSVIKTCTFYVVFVTVLINGGTAAPLLQKLKLKRTDNDDLLSLPLESDSPFPANYAMAGGVTGAPGGDGEAAAAPDGGAMFLGGLVPANGTNGNLIGNGTNGMDGTNSSLFSNGGLGQRRGERLYTVSVLEEPTEADGDGIQDSKGKEGRRRRRADRLSHISLPIGHTPFSNGGRQGRALREKTSSVGAEGGEEGKPGEEADGPRSLRTRSLGTRSLQKVREFTSSTLEQRLEKLGRSLSRHLINAPSQQYKPLEPPTRAPDSAALHTPPHALRSASTPPAHSAGPALSSDIRRPLHAASASPQLSMLLDSGGGSGGTGGAPGRSSSTPERPMTEPPQAPLGSLAVPDGAAPAQGPSNMIPGMQTQEEGTGTLADSSAVPPDAQTSVRGLLDAGAAPPQDSMTRGRSAVDAFDLAATRNNKPP